MGRKLSGKVSTSKTINRKSGEKMALTTDWIVIGTAGETIDGRVIEDSWLEEAAETFDADNYTPVINAEHMRYYGSFGEVLALRTGEDSRKRKNLQAILKPNFEMCSLNKEGQKLFTSMELNTTPDGKIMLSGLALTDNPASFGTSAIKLFSKNRDIKEFSSPIPISIFSDAEVSEDQEDIADKKIDSAVSRFFSKLFGKDFSTIKPEPETQPSDLEDDDMKPEQFEELKELFSTSLEKISVATKTAQTAADDTDENYASLQERFSALEAENAQLTEKVSGLETKLDEALKDKPGTQTEEFTSGADDETFV
jgi:hypothetical protein